MHKPSKQMVTTFKHQPGLYLYAGSTGTDLKSPVSLNSVSCCNCGFGVENRGGRVLGEDSKGLYSKATSQYCLWETGCFYLLGNSVISFIHTCRVICCELKSSFWEAVTFRECPFAMRSYLSRFQTCVPFHSVPLVAVLDRKSVV